MSMREKMRDNSTKIIFMTGRQSQHKIIVDTVKKINNGPKSVINFIKDLLKKKDH